MTVTATIDGSTIASDPVCWPDDFPINSNASHRLAASRTPTVSLPDDFELPEGNEPVAQFPFKDGVVVVIREEQPNVTYFWTAELFTDGGEGLVGGGPSESWQGCYRVDYSDAGYAIVIVEDPDWTVHVGGDLIDVIPVGDVAMALVEGLFDRPPPVAVSADGNPAC